MTPSQVEAISRIHVQHPLATSPLLGSTSKVYRPALWQEMPGLRLDDVTNRFEVPAGKGRGIGLIPRTWKDAAVFALNPDAYPESLPENMELATVYALGNTLMAATIPGGRDALVEAKFRQLSQRSARLWLGLRLAKGALTGAHGLIETNNGQRTWHNLAINDAFDEAILTPVRTLSSRYPRTILV